MTWRIVCDSSCDLSPALVEDDQVGFASVPLKIVVGETEYVDEATTDVDAMLRHMLSYKGPSSSSCPSPEAFGEEFKKADWVIAPTISCELSGTYNCALRARDIVLEECPDKKIFVLDSHATSGVMILLVQKALQLIKSGKGFEEVTRALQSYGEDLHILFSLSSFDNLVKTGRMSKVSGILASALGIRAIATNTKAGEISVLEKPRGVDKAIERMVALMATLKEITAELPVVITHCNNLEGAQRLKKAIFAAYGAGNVTILPTRCLTSFYAGTSGLLLSF